MAGHPGTHLLCLLGGRCAPRLEASRTVHLPITTYLDGITAGWPQVASPSFAASTVTEAGRGLRPASLHLSCLAPRTTVCAEAWRMLETRTGE